jgi:hypothetical protein
LTGFFLELGRQRLTLCGKSREANVNDSHLQTIEDTNLEGLLSLDAFFHIRLGLYPADFFGKGIPYADAYCDEPERRGEKRRKESNRSAKTIR